MAPKWARQWCKARMWITLSFLVFVDGLMFVAPGLPFEIARMGLTVVSCTAKVKRSTQCSAVFCPFEFPAASFRLHSTCKIEPPGPSPQNAAVAPCRRRGCSGVTGCLQGKSRASAAWVVRSINLLSAASRLCKPRGAVLRPARGPARPLEWPWQSGGVPPAPRRPRMVTANVPRAPAGAHWRAAGTTGRVRPGPRRCSGRMALDS